MYHLFARRFFLAIQFVLISFLLASPGLAQSVTPDPQPSPTPQPSPGSSLERRFVKNVLRDQRAIWTAPFATQKSEVRWIAPLAISSAVLFATDRHTAGELAEPGDHHSRLNLSKDISKGGAFYTTTGIASAFYLVGRGSHNRRARETGLLGLEALIDEAIVTSAIKAASQRPRPTVDDASGEFYDKGSSFPSGHAASVWSLATVIAHEYGRHRPLVQVATYGAATAVSLARFTGQNHFLSDVLIGSAIGYGIGRYVYRTNHDPTLDTENATSKPQHNHSRLIPAASPGYSRSARVYGVRLEWTF